ncbi:hypothetical protein TKK_0001576 [Trichogramma kaykai]
MRSTYGPSKETPNVSVKAKTPEPPPIFISNVETITPLLGALNEANTENFTLKTVPDNKVKIQPTTSEVYVPIVTLLKKNKALFHTYQLKKDKPYKAVLKNIHQSTDVDELKKEIESHGHIVTRISNILQHNTKKPLPLFTVELKAADNIKEIFNITRLQHTIVLFEAPRKYRDMPQLL